MILAAIDIGSNAIRLLITQTTTLKDGSVDFTRLNFLRIPLRLGMDVFQKGFISEAKVADFIDAMKAYEILLRLYRVDHYRACATSAMRDARNGTEIIDAIRKQTGVEIETISGDQEASLLYDASIAETRTDQQPCLYIDVGGGSTELTMFSQNKIVFKESFNIGTIRLLNHSVPAGQMDALKDFVKSRTRGLGKIKALGTGGNINKLHSMSKLKSTKPLSVVLLKAYLHALEALTVEERMHLYDLRRDRADVIVPALQIYISVLRAAKITQIHVPKIGLADGLIQALYHQYGPKPL